MKAHKNTAKVVFMIVVGMFMLTGVASANTATYGADYSQDTSNETYITVYDGTNDPHSVYSNYHITNNGSTFRVETFGGRGSSEVRGPIYWLTEHQVCQNRQYQPDVCSGWVMAIS